jgi:hypothetical protein
MQLSVSAIRARAHSTKRRVAYLVRHYWMAALFAFGLALAQGTAYAQVGGLEGKLTTVMTNLTTIGRPMAGLALVAVVLSYIAEPALPDWARENKGALRRVMAAALFLGLVPDFVTFLFT